MSSTDSVLSALDQLSDSTEQSISIGAANFARSLERYQNEAKSIESTLQALYRQMAEMARTPQISPEKSKITEQMIANVQDRLNRLDEERKELSEQMNRLSSLTDITSGYGSRRQSPQGKASFLQFSDASTSQDLGIQALRSENKSLKTQLIVERQKNRTLKRGFTDAIQLITRQNQSFASRIADVIKGKVSKIDSLTKRIKTVNVRNKTKSDALHHLSSEFAGQKAAISETFDEFRSTMFDAKFSALSRIGSNRKAMNQRDTNSKQDSIFLSPRDLNKTEIVASKITPIVTPIILSKDKDRAIQLLAFGCDELASCILSKFDGKQSSRSVARLVRDKSAFAKYISNVCSLQEKGVHQLTEELETAKANLEEVKNKLSSHEVSTEVEKVTKKILARLKNVSDQMEREHNILMSRLS